MGLMDGEEMEEDISPTLTLRVMHRLDFRLRPVKRSGGTSSKPCRPRTNPARSRGRNQRPSQSRQRSPARSSRRLTSTRPMTMPGCSTCVPSVGRIAKRVLGSGRLPDAPSVRMALNTKTQRQISFSVSRQALRVLHLRLRPKIQHAAGPRTTRQGNTRSRGYAAVCLPALRQEVHAKV